MPPTHVSRVTLCLPQHTDSSSPSPLRTPRLIAALRSHHTIMVRIWGSLQGSQKNDDTRVQLYRFSYKRSLSTHAECARAAFLPWQNRSTRSSNKQHTLASFLP
jgi:hypothetical protein